MKLHLEAESADEVRAKTPALLHRLAKALGQHSPELHDLLEKASMVPAPREMKHEALRNIFGDVTKQYGAMLDRMLADIGAALDETVDAMAKSSPDYASGIIREEQLRFQKVKDDLALFGIGDESFEEDGRLYGMTIGELQALHSQLKTQQKTD